MCSVLFLLLGLNLFQFLLRNEAELSLVVQKKLLVRLLLLSLLLQDGLLGLILGSFCFGLLLLLLSFDVGVELLLILPLLSDVLALLNLPVPQVLDVLLLILLFVFEGHRYLVEEESATFTVSVSHELLVVVLLQVLEGHHHGTSGEVERQTWLVRLVQEVPNVESSCLSDEDDTRTSRGKGATSVVGAESQRRPEDGLFGVLKRHFPQGEMEVMNSQD